MNSESLYVTGDTGATIGYLERLRGYELERVRDCFEPKSRVLEVGGANGYQASVIASWGCDVISIDVADRPPSPIIYHPVHDYDGQRLPFPDRTFDLVFSSHVLEHIRDFSSMLEEMRRVLKPNGMAIHILPTPGWRFWTSLSHYGYILKRLVGGQKNTAAAIVPSVTEQLNKRGYWWVMRRALFAGPHGEYPNAIGELWYFSRKRWLAAFANAGYVVERDYPTNLFYTGYCLVPGFGLSARRELSRFLGSACRVFVMHPLSAG